MKQKLNYKNIGIRVKKLRIAMDITQQELAEIVELSVSHISNIETNKTKVSLESLYNIAGALNCTIDELVRDGEIADRALANALFDNCDEYERRMVREVVKTLKYTMKRNKVTSVDIKGK